MQDEIKELKKQVLEQFKKVREEAGVDLEIDEINLDESSMASPKLYSKYMNLYSENLLYYKEMVVLRDKVRLERWKYYSGKQTDKYYAENGRIHEAILRTDVDKYLDADARYVSYSDLAETQKMFCDFLEKTLKEINNRNFHIKSAIEWRKFVSGS